MNFLLRTLADWTTHQDYFWFLAVLAWCSVAIGAWPRGGQNRARDAWLAGWALANLASALIELVLLSQDLRSPYLLSDRAMIAAQCVATSFVLWGGMNPRWRAARVRAIAGIGAVMAAAVLARNQWPVAGGLFAALVHVVAMRSLLRRNFGGVIGSQGGRAAMVGSYFLLFWPLLATHGPLAHATGRGRINDDFVQWALPAASVLALGGIAWSVAIWRQRLREAEGPDPVQGSLINLRPGLALLAAWLLAGFGLLVGSGRLARRDYEASLIARARTAVQVLDPELVDRALGPTLQAGKIETHYYADGTPAEVIALPAATGPDFVALRGQLVQIQQANPDLRYVYLTAIRSDRMAILATAKDVTPKKVWRLVDHIVTEDDLKRAASKETFIVGPVRTTWGPLISAHSPLLSSATGRVLGWLVLDVPGSRWLTEFVQARLQTMAFIGVGVGLWGLGLAYTLRRSASAAATRRAEAAAEADRLKSEFLAIVSHELRTPIQSVLGYGELLAGESLPGAAPRWVEALRSHGQVMLRLVNDLIDYGTLQSGAFRLQARVVELRRLVEDCVTAIRPQAIAKGLAVRCELVDPLPEMVYCDPVRVRQVLLNLLANAVKFTAEGSVRLVVRGAFSSKSATDTVPLTFVVSDTGPGIPPERRDELFKPFARLSAPGEIEGTGLGLALVARLCASMGGTVQLAESSEPGATFVATLPLEVAGYAGAPPVVVAAPEPRRAWTGLAMLVAEDNRLVRALLVDFLSRQGANVVAVADGATALAAAERQAFQVVLLDWRMPGIGGLEVARELRARSAKPDRPFIIGLSAHAEADSFAQAHAAGMNAFLVKPVDLGSLGQTISQAPGVPALTGAPVATEAALMASLQSRFSAELPGLVAEITAAAETGDWHQARARSHYLKNSADLVGARALATVCLQLCHRDAAPPPPLLRELAGKVAGAARRPFG